MGKLFSKCWGRKKTEQDYKRLDDVYPFPCQENVTTPLEKNDEKFFFIKNEQKIDKVINYLDELSMISEQDITLLEKTLAELRTLKLEYIPSSSPYSLLGQIFRGPAHKVNGEQKSDSHKSYSDKNSQGEEHIQAKSPNKNIFSKQSSLMVEIQKASFLHIQLIEKHKLKHPYVVVNIYPGTKGINIPQISSTTREIKTFETLADSSSMRPDWHQLFEYNFDENEEIQTYSIGFSLFYISELDDSIFQVGQEQIYAFSGLLDQKVQSKQIDFKGPISKGLIAKLRIRLQLLHNVEKIRARNLREIRTRIEKLTRIKKKYINLFPDRNEFESTIHSTKLAFSETESLASLSSAHDNEEITYFVS